MQIVAQKRSSTTQSYNTSPSQMELIKILGRSLHGVVHFFWMRPVAHACRPLPYSFSTNDGRNLSGPVAGRETSFARLL